MMTRYCVMSMDYGKTCFVYDKKMSKPVSASDTWESTAKAAAELNENLKTKGGKR